MDHINKVLAFISESLYRFSMAIHAALAIGKKVMNKYYNKTDHSEVYWIAMVLHPCHKLEYFKAQKLDDSWIQAAHDIIWEEYEHSYKLDNILGDDDDDVAANNEHSVSSMSTNIFDNLPDLSPTSSELSDELDRYLASDVEGAKDMLMWWYEKLGVYPCLSRMAHDYLTIPATTLDVEHTFSQGCLVLPHVRNRLNFQLTHALMCVSAWSLLSLIDNSVIKAALEVDITDKEELADGWDAILH
ncbi:hypothetical protein CVT25_005213 [Psilocybe cyanescens]|uniref:HAT C-terminal dimerisation domain-containing protein n=1 Tax=Psilocybe cyanescens TaxID=93625 RepID=A0A409XRS0_PSICY|nr:hypothetical protein CVT25_005213 [Psilocybe cyanescens]